MAKFVTLLVEDDDLQRETLADILASEGFEVVECSTAEAAELVVTTTGMELRALITDQQLQGAMTGAELVKYARGKFPDLNVIVMSGHKKPHLPPRVRFLQKPFASADFLAAVLA
jgi:DNA-binding NtrC family response regulator